jgi:hypothetical protein
MFLLGLMVGVIEPTCSLKLITIILKYWNKNNEHTDTQSDKDRQTDRQTDTKEVCDWKTDREKDYNY